MMQTRNMLIGAVAALLAVAFLITGVSAQSFPCKIYGTATDGTVTISGAGTSVGTVAEGGSYSVELSNRIPSCVGFEFTAIHSDTGETVKGVFQEPSLRLDFVGTIGDPEEPVTCGEGTRLEGNQCVPDGTETERIEIEIPDPEATVTGTGVGVAVGALAVWFLNQRRSGKGTKDSDLDRIFSELAKRAKAGSGFRVFFRDGKYWLKHLHYGIAGYHDPGQNHRKVYHPPGAIIIEEDEK